MEQPQLRRIAAVKHRTPAVAFAVDFVGWGHEYNYIIHHAYTPQACDLTEYPQTADFEQIDCLFGEFSEPVGKVVFELIKISNAVDRGEASVGIHPEPLASDIFGREERAEHSVCIFTAGKSDKVDGDVDFRNKFYLFAAQLGDFHLEKLTVEIETDHIEVSGLLCAQQISGAAYLKVAQGKLETCPLGGASSQRRQPFSGVRGDDGIARQKHIGVRLTAGAANSSAQLVEFGKTEAVGSLYNNSIGVGDIQTGFDDGGGNQTVDLSGNEVAHHLFELFRRHPGVGDGYPAVRQIRLQHFGAAGDGVDPVVQIVHLSAAGEFGADGSAGEPDVLRRDHRPYRSAQLGGGGLDPLGAKEIMAFFKELQTKYNKTIIMISHDMDLVYEYATRCVVLEKGELVFDGSKEELFKEKYACYHLDKPRVLKTIDYLNQTTNRQLSYNHYNLDDLLKSLKAGE